MGNLGKLQISLCSLQLLSSVKKRLAVMEHYGLCQ